MRNSNSTLASECLKYGWHGGTEKEQLLTKAGHSLNAKDDQIERLRSENQTLRSACIDAITHITRGDSALAVELLQSVLLVSREEDP